MKKILKGICLVLCSCAWVYSANAENIAPAEEQGETISLRQELASENQKLFTGSAELRKHLDSDKQYLVWSLAEINRMPVSVADMQIAGVSLGKTETELRQILGVPETIQRGISATYYRYPQAAVTIRHSLPEDIRQAFSTSWTKASIWQGVSSIQTETEKYPSARGLAVGNSRENILRVYGRPQQMWWDAKNRKMYYIYGNDDIGWLTFEVDNLQIQAIRLDKIFPGMATRKKASDYQLLGMEVAKPYQSPAWSVWETRVEQDLMELWLFKDFGVAVHKDSHKIERIFLLSPQVTTPRGIALSDSLSTLQHIYGEPDITEVNEKANITLYYYEQSKKTPIYLVFVIDNQKKEIIDIILSATKIEPNHTAEQRYGLH